MLTIRLTRIGKVHRPFYRIVLTDHKKAVQSGYKAILGWFDPIQHTMEVDLAVANERIAKGAKPSERVAKLMYNKSKDEMYQKFFTKSVSQKKTRKPDKFAK